MQNSYVTLRLSLTKISLKDASLILKLVNTPKWIAFIGDRNVNTLKEAETYIQKILMSENTQYWVIKLKETEIPIGVVTLLQRDYLSNPDIGFAFLDEFIKQGYAFEAASEIVKHALITYKSVSAITLSNNIDAIKLLEKLNFRYNNEIKLENEELLHYQITYTN